QWGLEVEAVSVSFGEVEHMLTHAGPAVLMLDGESGVRVVLVLKGGFRGITLIRPDHKNQRVSPGVLSAAFTRNIAEPVRERVSALLDGVGIPEFRRACAQAFIVSEQLGAYPITGAWLLRMPPSANFWLQLKHARIPLRMLVLLGAHALQQGLQILGWWLIARGALAGHFDRVWLLAWCLVLFTSIPFDVLVTWTQSRLAVAIGRLFKQRLLFGSLHLNSEEVRHQGVGQFLGRVLEAQTLETLALGGGFTALIAVVELAAAAAILALGAGGLPHALLLIVWLGITIALGWRYANRSQEWRRAHRYMINALIERMVGHRTRLAQADPRHFHDDEDQTLAQYIQLSDQMDASAIQLSALVTRVWSVLGLAGMAHALFTTAANPTSIAISLGGIMLAGRGLTNLTNGMQSVVGVLNAWRQIAPLFHAATRAKQSKGTAALVDAQAPVGVPAQPLLIARELVFRYRDYGQPVLRGVDLRIFSGDRLLLEGASGGGKSTLAALFTGLRTPTSGLLLLHGLDWQTLGSADWRQRVVAAPQFHENHVLAETLAFNLLMGRRWPPTRADLEEAEQICRELGLGDLLERMPAGLQQMVGESGWRLSHGERSRLYIARTLLQRADLIVLDESFAALDPENLRLALRCVLNRASTLMVIAHP
ncbi:MAG: ABC transporter ATP-binding protein, partial [Gammaproteobacteria bacterium]